MTFVKSFGQTAVAPQGAGTSADPYVIATLDNLYWVSQNSSSWAAGKYFCQTADIDASSSSTWNSGAGWTPIGNSSVRFKGNYNGNSKKITGLTIVTVNSPNRGLFGVIDAAVIRNIILENMSLTFTATPQFTTLGTGSGCLIGATIGAASTVENNSVVNSSLNNPYWLNGIFVGEVASNSTFSNCSVTGSSLTSTSTNAIMLGGFVGRIGAAATFNYCSANAQVSTNSGRSGGFAGQTEHGGGTVTFNNCSSSGTVTGILNPAGFIGLMYGSIAFNDCYSTSAVTWVGNSGTSSVGGFFGWTWSSVPGITFNRCYSTGLLTGSTKGGFGGSDNGLAAVVYNSCFWDTQTSGTTTGVGTANRTGLTGQTTANMKTQSTFTNAGWDFTTVWSMASGVNSGYPAFQSSGYTPTLCSGGNNIACTVGAASSTPSVCNGATLTNITHTTTAATGIGAATGLPAGVTATWASNTITISGTPTQSGTFNYSIPLTGGGCSGVNATGTITVSTTSVPTVAPVSNQTLCNGASTTPISFSPVGTAGFQWMTINSVSSTTASGTGQNGITATITHSGGGMSANTGMYSANLFPAQYSVPSSGTQLRNDNAGIFTVTFSQPVTNPLIAFASVGSPSRAVPVIVSAPFTPIWSYTGTPGWTTTYDLPNNKFTGAEGFNIIRIDGTVTSVSFNYTVAESYSTVCFGFVDQNVSYNWTNSDPTIGLAATGTGNILSFTAQNTSGTPKVANLTVTPVQGACEGTPENFTITVNPKPDAGTISGTLEICEGSTSTLSSNGAKFPLDRGLHFNGAHPDVVTVNSAFPVASGDFTVEAWVKPTLIDAQYHGFFGADQNGRDPSMWVGPNGTLHTDSYSGSTRYDIFTANNFFSTNTWTHVAWVKEGTTYKIYRNGVLNITEVAPNNVTIFNNYYRFGRVDNFFSGALDEFRIWNVARTQDQIQINMNKEIAAQTNLVAYYNFNNGTPGGTNTGVTTLSDNSGGTRNGTLSAFTLSGSTSNWVEGALVGGNWTSSNTSVATVDALTGVVTGVAEGTSTISYTIWGPAPCGSSSATADVTISAPAAPATITGTQAICAGSTTQFTAAVASRALDMDGTNDYVSLPSGVYFDDNTFTIESWVYVKGNPNWHRVIDFGNGASNNTVSLALSQGTTGYPALHLYDVNGNLDRIDANRALPLNQWVHIAAVRNGTTGQLYVNGELWASNNSLVLNTANVTRTQCYIGRSLWGVDGNSDAKFGEVRIWSVARTAAELAGNANAILSPQAGLVAYYRFNQGTPDANNAGVTTLTDYSGNGYNGTLNNFALTGTTSNWTSRNALGSGTWSSSNTAVATVDQNGLVTGVASGTATITFTAAGQGGCADVISTRTVTVSPAITVNQVASQYLNTGGTTSPVAFTSSTAGVTYNWTNSNTAIIPVSQASGNIASFAVTNNGTDPISTTISVTATGISAGITCSSAPMTFQIVVNPVAVMNQTSNQEVCPGATTADVNFTSANTGGTVTYAWTNNNTSIGLAASGTGNIPAFTATNTTSDYQTATITVTPTYTNGGTSNTGASTTFTITVKPKSSVTQVANQVYCNGATGSVSFGSPVSGTTYAWTNSNTAIGLAASGTGNIANFQTTNTGITAISGTVTVTPTSNGCVGSPITFTITVNPTPTASTTTTSQVVCVGATIPAATFTTPVAGTVVNWTNSNPSIGLAASGTGNIPSFTATNTGNAPAVGTITVRPTLGNGTSGRLSYTVYSTHAGNGNTSQYGPYPNNATEFDALFNTANSNTTVHATGEANASALLTFYSQNDLINNGISVPNGGEFYGVKIVGTFIPVETGNYVFGVDGDDAVEISIDGSVVASFYGGHGFAGLQQGQPVSLVAGQPYRFMVRMQEFNGGDGLNVAWRRPSQSNLSLQTDEIFGEACYGPSVTYTVTVNPVPNVAAQTNQLVCAESTVTANLAGTVAGTTYSWTNTNPAIGLAASGTGSTISFTATNAGPDQISGSITVTPTYQSLVSGTAATIPTTVGIDYATRMITYTGVSINGGGNSAVVTAGSSVNLNYNFSVAFNSSTGYCPGCIVQSYIGIGGTTQTIRCESSIRNGTTGARSVSFTAPSTPGVYYLTQSGTLDYICQPQTFSNASANAIGVIIVPEVVVCTGTPVTFTVTVNPKGQVNTVNNQVLCNGSATAAVTFATTNNGLISSGGTQTASSGTIAVAIPDASATGTSHVIPVTLPTGAVISNMSVNFNITHTWDSDLSINLVAPNGQVLNLVNRRGGSGENFINTTISPTATTTLSSGSAPFTGTYLPDAATGVGATAYPSTAANFAALYGTANGNWRLVIRDHAGGDVGTLTGWSLNFSYAVQGAFGTNMNWTNTATSIGLAASGTGHIPSFTATNTGTAPVVSTVTVTPTYFNGGLSCPGTPITYTYTVNPTPTVNTVATQTFCAGTPATVSHAGTVPGTVYSWTNSNPAIGLPASGTGSLSFTPINTGTTPITATITVTPSYTNAGITCTGTPRTYTIMVNPVGQVNVVNSQVLCNGSATAAVAFATVNGGGTVTPGTPITANSGAITVAIPDNNPAGVAHTIPVTLPASSVVTKVTANFNITHTWDSDLSINLVAPNGQVLNLVNRRGGSGDNFTNTTISPTATTAIAAGSAPFTGTFLPDAAIGAGSTSFASTAANFAALYSVGSGDWRLVIRDHAGGDVGTLTGWSLTFEYGALIPAVTSYAWTNNTPSIGLAASGTGNIASFTAINTTAAPVTSTVTVTPTYTNNGVGCVGTPITYTYTVNPTPTVNAVANQTVCRGSNVAAITFSGATTGTVYTWTNSNTAIGLGASGTGDIASFVGTNTTAAPITATITVTPSYTNAGQTCVGTPRTFTITVNPIPTVNAVSSFPVCHNLPVAVNFTGATTGTLYSWTNTNPAIGLGASGTGNLSFTATNPNTGGAPITATITVTPSYTNNGVTCVGTPTSFTITVNPLPVVSAGTLPSRICLSDTLVKLNGTPVGGSWSGIGTSGTNFIPTATNIGSYALTYTYADINGCVNRATITANVLACEERNRDLDNDAVILYPNPNSGQFNLRVNSTRFNVLGMKVYSALGQLVSVKQWGGLVYARVIPVNLSNLAAGTYMVRLYYGDGMDRGADKTYKIIIAH